ncbi:12608_t:CDS:2, partial [Funneliformis caledonium]
MVVPYLHPDILPMIFECLVKTFEPEDLKSLYHCVLVNRNWCQNAIPVLWSNPFRFLTENRETITEVILMYMACFDENKKKELFSDAKIPKEVVKTPTFNYPSYLKHLNYWELVNSMNETARNLSNVKELETIQISERSTYLKSVDAPKISKKLQSFVVNYIIENARINSLVVADHYGYGFILNSTDYKIVADRKFFENIRKLELVFDYQDIYDIIDWLPTHCKNVKSLRIQTKHHNQKSLSNINKFIDALKDLKKFKFRYFYRSREETDCVPLISNHIYSLRVVEIRHCCLKGSKIVEEIAKCKNLEVLRLISCVGLYYKMAEPLITADLPKLKDVELIGNESCCKEVIEWAKGFPSHFIEDLTNANIIELADDTSVRPIPPESPAYPSSPDTPGQELSLSVETQQMNSRGVSFESYHDNPSITSLQQHTATPLLYTSFEGPDLREDEEDKCGLSDDEDDGCRLDKSSKRYASKLWIAIVISLLFFVTELAGGLIAGSLALLSDSFHLLSDVVSFAISLLSIYLARRPATKSLSYGYHRAEILGALLSIFLIWALTGYLCYEAYDRIQHPKIKVDGKTMSLLHVLGDFLSSVGVLISSIIIMVDETKQWVDPLCTFIFSALVMATTFGILRSGIRVLMEATPSHIDAHSVRKDLAEIEGVKSVHDLHIWDLTVGRTTLTCHLRLQPYDPDVSAEPLIPAAILSQARRVLKR